MGRKKELGSDAAVAHEVDDLLSALGAGPGATLDEDENSFDRAPARKRTDPGALPAAAPAPSAEADALWGAGRPKRK